MYSRVIIVAGLLAIFLCRPGLASSLAPGRVAGQVGESADISEVIVTSTRLPLSANRVTGSWSSLGKESLERVEAIHIQQALRTLPGVNLHRNNGQEYLPAIRSPVLSGPGACGSFLMAEDGIPLRPAGFCNVNELFEAHFEQASRVEVARGPGITLYGSNAMHGVVNVLGAASVDARPSVAIDGGPYDRARLKARVSSNDVSMAVTVSRDGGYREDSGVDQQKLSLGWQSSRTDTLLSAGLTATNLNQNTAGYLVGDDAYKDDDRVRSNPNPEAYRDAWSTRAWMRITDADTRPHWVVTPYLRVSGMEFLQHFLPGTPLEKNGQKSVGMQSAIYQYGENYALIGGFDIDYAEGYLEQSQQEDAGDPIDRPAGISYDYDVSALQLSPFLQLLYELTENLRLTGGLRFEHLAYDYDNLAGDGPVCPGCVYSRPADRRDIFNNWSPSLALRYSAGDSFAIELVAAKGFRAPQTGELYRLQGEQDVADLESEKLESLELNVSGRIKMFDYELAVYAMEKDNVIFRDSSDFNIDDGKTSHRGVELKLGMPLTTQLDLQLVGNYAGHRYDYHRIIQKTGVDIDGNDVDTAPRWFGGARLDWQVLDSLQLTLDWLSMGSYYTDPENLHKYSGHDLFNLAARWNIDANWQASLRILNLLDAEYAERADFSTFAGERYFPGEPLGLYASLRHQW